MPEQIQKPWYLSKTIWVNMLTLIVGLLGYLVGHEVVQEYPAIVSVFLAIQGGVNIILRFLTSLPLGAKNA